MTMKSSIITIVLNTGTQNIPFYLQDENGDTYEFGWKLIYEYIANLNDTD